MGVVAEGIGRPQERVHFALVVALLLHRAIFGHPVIAHFERIGGNHRCALRHRHGLHDVVDVTLNA